MPETSDGDIKAGNVVNGLGSKLRGQRLGDCATLPPPREKRHQCTQRLGHKSLPYCPVGLSAALGSGNNLVEYAHFKKGLQRWR